MRNLAGCLVVSGVMVFSGCASPGAHLSGGKPYQFPASPGLDPVTEAVYEVVKASEKDFETLRGDPLPAEEKRQHLAQIEEKWKARPGTSRDHVIKAVESYRRADYHQANIDGIFKGTGMGVGSDMLIRGVRAGGFQKRVRLSFTINTGSPQAARGLARDLYRKLESSVMPESRGWKWKTRKDHIEQAKKGINTIKESIRGSEGNNKWQNKMKERLRIAEEMHNKKLKESGYSYIHGGYNWSTDPSDPRKTDFYGVTFDYKNNKKDLKVTVNGVL
ncbi:hypothetical protein [Thiohalorhabdus methylotrophus]|uniref:Lipoprotein n=1 Tax=Thiohalorhabdus methylotrophus TaxID=3242694 RepID=A0ABV4TXX7_9GAMM